MHNHLAHTASPRRRSTKALAIIAFSLLGTGVASGLAAAPAGADEPAKTQCYKDGAQTICPEPVFTIGDGSTESSPPEYVVIVPFAEEPTKAGTTNPEEPESMKGIIFATTDESAAGSTTGSGS